MTPSARLALAHRVLASGSTDYRTLREVLAHMLALAHEQDARITALEARTVTPRGIDGRAFLGLDKGE